MKAIWVSWERQRRSVELAQAFGAKPYFLLETSDEIPNRLVRTCWLSLKTLGVLLREVPPVVFAQNPSIFLTGLLCVVKPIFRFVLIVDRHSNFKFHKGDQFKWRVFRALSGFTLRRAELTIVTNAVLAEHVESNGGRAFVLQDRLPTFSAPERDRGVPAGRSAVCISGYGEDEPLLELIEASSSLPNNWTLTITGNSTKFRERHFQARSVPSRIHFSGFLSEDDYLRLLANADLVITLTTQEHTLNCGAYEAVALGRPMLLSDTAAIRDYFREGAVYSGPAVDSLRESLREAVDNLDELHRGVRDLRTRLESSWRARFAELVERVESLTAH